MDRFTVRTWSQKNMISKKFNTLKDGMNQVHIDILGIKKLKWIVIRHFQSDHTVWSSGHENYRTNSIAFIDSKDSAWVQYNCWTSVRLHTQLFYMAVIQVYAATTGAEEEELSYFMLKLNLRWREHENRTCSLWLENEKQTRKY